MGARRRSLGARVRKSMTARTRWRVNLDGFKMERWEVIKEVVDFGGDLCAAVTHIRLKKGNTIQTLLYVVLCSCVQYRLFILYIRYRDIFTW